MKKIIFTISLFSLCHLPPASSFELRKAPAKLQTNLDFIVQKVLEKKNQIYRPEIALPKFYFASTTPLKQFQDALEKQWGSRPSLFTNAYAVANNEIYILDDATYYKKHQRCMDDSVAHELTHYIQVQYQGWDINGDDSVEWDAVEIQTAFRTEFCKF